ncbi:hypothetical protein VNO80_05031 [Phaseolus coccineus]|uniref:Transcription factor CBF/NF-Y/archaeal histone domain-containing protein n=1 Tax=Phaseolus coccineus TaxID=3886 RepID=A0AAN9P1T5_PHACN
MVTMAEEEENGVSIQLEFPKGRVKKIMMLDKDVKRVNSEALFLVSRSTELFLQFLAEKSANVSIEKKRKTVNLEHVRIAVKRHQPTRDFLLDDLPPPSRPAKPDEPPQPVSRAKLDAPPPGTRRIDQFFRKPEPQNPAQAQSPEIPAQAQSPEIPAQAQSPEIPAQAQSPEIPAQAQSPEIPAQAQSPEIPAQAQSPEIPAQAQSPEIPAQAQSPVPVDES